MIGIPRYVNHLTVLFALRGGMASGTPFLTSSSVKVGVVENHAAYRDLHRNSLLSSGVPLDFSLNDTPRFTPGVIGAAVQPAWGILNEATAGATLLARSPFWQLGPGWGNQAAASLLTFMRGANKRWWTHTAALAGSKRRGRDDEVPVAAHGDRRDGGRRDESPVCGVATCYSGHQFGRLAGQLGDGRSIIIFETTMSQCGEGGPQNASSRGQSSNRPADGVRSPRPVPCEKDSASSLASCSTSPLQRRCSSGWGNGQLLEVQLKGGQTTPYRRDLDGKLTLSAAVKEYLIIHVLHAYGVAVGPAFAIWGSATKATRERDEDENENIGGGRQAASVAAAFDDGPSDHHPTATLVRGMTSSLRIGTFEALFYTRRYRLLRRLVDFAIRAHFPEIVFPVDDSARVASFEAYSRFLEVVAARIARLTASWVACGFVHGVMNTDNLTVHGDTIDLGPCAFVDACDPDFTLSKDDLTQIYVAPAGHGLSDDPSSWATARPPGVQRRYSWLAQPAAGFEAVERLATCLTPLLLSSASGIPLPAEDVSEAVERIDEYRSERVVAEVRRTLAGLRPIYTRSYLRHYARAMAIKLGVRRDDPTGAAELCESGDSGVDIDVVRHVTRLIHILHAAGASYPLFFRSITYLDEQASRRRLCQRNGAADLCGGGADWKTTASEDPTDWPTRLKTGRKVIHAALQEQQQLANRHEKSSKHNPLMGETADTVLAAFASWSDEHVAKFATELPRNPALVPTNGLVNDIASRVTKRFEADGAPDAAAGMIAGGDDAPLDLDEIVRWLATDAYNVNAPLEAAVLPTILHPHSRRCGCG